jgi:hypothetical protein
MACMMHSTVGLQHAAMAFYNAYADRVPLFAMVGAILDAQNRRNYVDWHGLADRRLSAWHSTRETGQGYPAAQRSIISQGVAR